MAMVSKLIPIQRPATFSIDNTSHGPKTIPKNEAAPILKVLGFFSTQPAIIRDAGRQKASSTVVTAAKIVNPMSAAPVRINTRATAAHKETALKRP
jgi:hypothetical protein